MPSLLATVGVSFQNSFMNIDGQRVKVSIWDTAGQTHFHKITRAYYKNSHGIVLVYDVTGSPTILITYSLFQFTHLQILNQIASPSIIFRTGCKTLMSTRALLCIKY